MEEKIFDIMIGAFRSLRASNGIGSRAHKYDPEKAGYSKNSYGDKPKTSSARRQLDRAIVDGKANLVVPGGSAKALMSLAGMVDRETTKSSNDFNRTRHSGAPYGEQESARKASLENTQLVAGLSMISHVLAMKSERQTGFSSSMAV